MEPLIPPLSSSRIWWEDEQGPLLFEMDIDLSIFFLKAVQIMTKTHREYPIESLLSTEPHGAPKEASWPLGCTHTDENKSSTQQASVPCSTLTRSRKWNNQMVWHRGSHGGVIWGCSEWEEFMSQGGVIPDQKASLRKKLLDGVRRTWEGHSFFLYFFCIFIFIHTLFNSVNFVWSMISILHMKKLRL